MAGATRSDPVTALPNQRALYRFLDAEVPRAIRHAHPFPLLMVDGDNLKTLNDVLGYTAGDGWIKTLAALYAKHEPATRSGRRRPGDEFVAALPETTRTAACSLAERIRSVVERAPGRLQVPLTVSIGVAAFPADGGTVNELLARVERANGPAKRAGENCIAVVDGSKV